MTVFQTFDFGRGSALDLTGRAHRTSSDPVDHISDALICLNWLRVPERVEFKIAVLTHKVLCGVAPRYLEPLNRVTDISGRCLLRSSGTNRLVVPPFRLSTVGSWAFPVAAAKIWNALPDSLVSITSPSSFRHHLKTFLFQRSFS